MKRLILAAMAVCAMGFSARAQVIHGKDSIRYIKDTRIDFGGVLLPGTPDKPTVVFVQAPPKAKFPSLIKYRANFDPELQASQAKL